MTKYNSWLAIGLVKQYEPIAKSRNVSEVARSSRGFLTQYKKAKGNPNAVSDEWAAKREAFIARHIGYVKKNGEKLWDDKGPTRRHLALIMWAYSPTPSKLSNWIRSRAA